MRAPRYTVPKAYVGLRTEATSYAGDNDLIQVFKILKGFDVIDEQLFFKRHISNTRGRSVKLYKDGVNNRGVLKFSFTNRVSEQLNKLPGTVISANSINSF